jgi:hypothetical protein
VILINKKCLKKQTQQKRSNRRQVLKRLLRNYLSLNNEKMLIFLKAYQHSDLLSFLFFELFAQHFRQISFLFYHLFDCFT